MIIKRFKQSWAKTSHHGQTLYDHTLACVKAGIHLSHYWPNFELTQLDTLVFGLFIHDIGKLDPIFQAMLQSKLDGQTFNGRFVKHEARTFEHDHIALVENNFYQIINEIKTKLGYAINADNLTADAVEWAWTCAVTHHGLYYFSYEQMPESDVKRIARRQQTGFSPYEVKRRTLTDLLFNFHPLGGIVIMADQLASHAFEKRYDLGDLFERSPQFSDILTHLFNTADETEAALKQDDPADYQLLELLTLLAPV